MKKALVIINPKAGKTASKTMLFDIVYALNQSDYEAKVQITMYKNHATEIVINESKKKLDLIIAVGGDGTLNEATQGIMLCGKKIPLGYIPAGSTNDFAVSAGISTKVKTALNDILNGVDTQMDIGKFNGRYFNYVASFGAFTSVSYKTPQETKNALGHLAYIIEGVKDMGSITPCHMKIDADGVIYEGDYVFGAIGNSTSIGGIIKLKEELVSLSDGIFEVILVKEAKNPADLSAIIHGFTFNDFSGPMFEFFKASNIKILSEGNFDWSLDGEFAKGEKEIEITNINKGYILRKGLKK